MIFKVNYTNYVNDTNAAITSFLSQDVADPIVTLPHYLHFTIFHLHSVESLEGQPVPTQDRQEAFVRLSLGKMRLEKI
jgi:hypothetical protein